MSMEDLTKIEVQGSIRYQVPCRHIRSTLDHPSLSSLDFLEHSFSYCLTQIGGGNHPRRGWGQCEVI